MAIGPIQQAIQQFAPGFDTAPSPPQGIFAELSAAFSTPPHIATTKHKVIKYGVIAAGLGLGWWLFFGRKKRRK